MTTQDELRLARHHAAWAALDELIARAKTTSPRSSTDRETISRLVAVAQYLRRYQSTNFRLMPSNRLAVLDRVALAAEYLSNYLEGWDQAGAMPVSTVKAIDNYVDELVGCAAQWPALPKPERDRVNEEAEEASREATSAALDGLLADVAQAHGELASLRASAAETQSRTNRIADEAGDALDLMSSTLETLSQQAESQRREFSDLNEDRAREQRVLIQDAADKFLEQLRESGSSAIKELEDDRDTAKKLLAFVSDGSVSGGYGKYAKSELNAYRLWNALGALTALGGIAYLIWHFQDISGLDVAVTITRAALSVPIFGFTAFAFRQATLRHRNSVEATYRALDLLALPPFTHDMSDEERSKLRMVMGERIFARVGEDPEADANDAPDLTSENIASLTQLMKVVQGFTK
ncbi:hypothetical protein EDF52_10317 [Curtobacterium sp. PhB42]|uniref:hypothetical protein n=1 Tax=unclassified Curtobacterium TaxID=257496 RepID=UPI001062D33D|nr:MULTISPECIES: hypothetical protein [unclassified Curtobacterium]TDW50456.1 hypothetical protein EDF52_10317 [Curtobacterium sp. PhB42]TDW55241.1 hypothetical protein EDF47_106293 [Curtobacterium sp. PhB190]